ncbi:MAG: hypothetical protein ACLFS1_02540 [Opitutales bacterium]
MESFEKRDIYERFGHAPTLVAWVEGHLAEHGGAFLDTLVEAVDESPFSLRQWVEALVVMGEWLHSHRRQASLEDQIGYVSCAAASASHCPNEESLPDLVGEMLANYGFERTKPEEREAGS